MPPWKGSTELDAARSCFWAWVGVGGEGTDCGHGSVMSVSNLVKPTPFYRWRKCQRRQNLPRVSQQSSGSPNQKAGIP